MQLGRGKQSHMRINIQEGASEVMMSVCLHASAERTLAK
jgi:hypothetical protein